MKDNRGVSLEVEQIVAYNLSGQVALGEIVEIEHQRIRIQLLHDAAGFRTGHVSIARRSTNVLVIQDPDGDMRVP